MSIAFAQRVRCNRLGVRVSGKRWVAAASVVFCIGVLPLIDAPAASAASVLEVPSQYPTIQEALDHSVSGDTVVVQPGVYAERITLGGKDVHLTSVQGAEVTTIDGGLLGTTVDVGPGGAVEGFTITGGLDFFGAGMDVNGAGTLISHNTFRANQQRGGGYGAAIGGNNASPVITANRFEANSCSDAQHLSGVLGFINESSPTISNNLFVDNSCRAVNMSLGIASAPIVINNTMVGNWVALRVSGGTQVSTHAYRNNVLVANGVGLEITPSGTSEPIFDHNLVYGNNQDYLGITNKSGMSGNVSVDPLFEDPSAGDYRLNAGSPAIDVGSSAAAPSVDLNSAARPQDGNGDGIAAVDIGAYESPPVPTAPTIILNATPGDHSATVSWTAPLSDGGTPILGYVVTPYIGYFPLPPVPFGSTVTTQTVMGLTNGTTYRFRVQATNAIGTGPYSKVTNAVTPAPTAPAAPTIGAAVAGDGQATVSWTAPASDGGSPITGYVVTPYIGYYPLGPTWFNSTATTQTITGLTNGTTYRFRVRAYNGVGLSGYSTVSNPVTAMA